jgi:DNA (cytosine-5)-methyltransferase 1
MRSINREAKIVVLDRPSRIPPSKIKLNALSFFSGALGLDIGLKNAGINVVLACEIDRSCRNTIIDNNPDIGLIGDISAYDTDTILSFAGVSRSQVDLIVGGPPCQAFSTAGRRQGFEDERGNVFLKFIDLILDLKPRYAVIENVRGLLSAPLVHRPHAQRTPDRRLTAEELPGGALRHIIERLESGGYGISLNLYNSANYGVPQVRERVVMVCHRDGETLPFLNPTHSNLEVYGLPRWRTVRDAIADLPEHSDHLNFPEERLRYYRLLKEGQYWKHLPVDMQQAALGKSFFSGGGKTGFLRRLAWDKPSCTLVTHPAMPATDICHPIYDRPLSVVEYKRIQQFPDNWQFSGSIVDQYRQIGNAVPVGLGFAIGKLISDHAQGLAKSPPEGFLFSRYRGSDYRSNCLQEKVDQLSLFDN